MATWVETALIIWVFGLVFTLVGRGVTVVFPGTRPLGLCRLHQWARTERGFRCGACGWRCEADGGSGQDAPLAPPP